MSDDQVNSWKVIAAYHAPEPEPELPPDTHCPHGVDMDPKLDLPCHYCDEDRVTLLRGWVEARHFLWLSDDVKFLLERGDKLVAEKASVLAALELVRWLSVLDTPESDAGREPVTVVQICNKAREALARRWS